MKLTSNNNFMSLIMKYIYCSLFFLFLTKLSIAQVGIGTTNPDDSAILDIRSNSRGILIPRIALSGFDSFPVVNPAEGLMVYNTQSNENLDKGFVYWENSKWVNFKEKNVVHTDGYEVIEGTKVFEGLTLHNGNVFHKHKMGVPSTNIAGYYSVAYDDYFTFSNPFGNIFSINDRDLSDGRIFKLPNKDGTFALAEDVVKKNDPINATYLNNIPLNQESFFPPQSPSIPFINSDNSFSIIDCLDFRKPETFNYFDARFKLEDADNLYFYGANLQINDGEIINNSSSDSRLKNNIKKIEDPINKILRLTGNSFEWNEKQTAYKVGKKDYGVIAQEVKEVLPEAVTERKTGYLAVDYNDLIPLLIEAVKEQQMEIEKLKEQIHNL